MHTWTVTATSLAALAVSLYTFALFQRKPRLDVTLPHILRIEQQGGNILFYIQPTLSVRVKTEEVGVIGDTRLRLLPPSSIPSLKAPKFYWSGDGAWAYNATSDTLAYRWAGDPGPFTVSQETPQHPTLLFQADNWSFQPGRYEGSLQLYRPGNSIAVTKEFCLDISRKAVDSFRSGKQSNQFYVFRNDLPDLPSSGESAGCYALD
ncbi:hypothetical protein [Streptomyces exfoliatus]|uniref:hypothetical protein n=1 Tax=Streptomyces exfoliatus TaxID=1905 RepID=UPI003C2E4238